MSRHRPRKSRIKAREKLSKALESLPNIDTRKMMQDFEGLADLVDEKQDFEELVRAYSGKE